MTKFDLHLGDCLEILRTLPDASIDAIVTDPPYGLSFMGKRWDYDVPSVDVWAECLRVLKPGGHLLAFAGTRTQHRMAVRIEDAGFEIRDLIAWVYGSGFPKSHDVSKAIDKLDATEVRRDRQLRFTEWMRSTGLTSSQINALTDSLMGGHYLTAAAQPAVATREHFEKLRPHIAFPVPAWVEELIDERTVESENFKRREVVGKAKGKDVRGADLYAPGGGVYIPNEYDVTVAHTDAARAWQGWGTALKPALEPITVARKPLDGTVAQNVLTHGTGAINVDGCRVGTEGGTAKGSKPQGDGKGIYGAGLHGTCEIKQLDAGRWPANLIHDGSDEVVGLFPETGKSTGGSGKGAPKFGREGWVTEEQGAIGFGDSGSAARFFYCAKASKRDREEGLDAFEARRPAAAEFRPNHAEKAEAGEDGNPYGRWGEIRNTHPTVKPTDLMRYLCRLVTPPGGVVLDPFMGSGSTGKAAMREGFRFVGIEREPEYLEIARARIAAAFAPVADLGTPPAVNDNAPAQLDLFARGIE